MSLCTQQPRAMLGQSLELKSPSLEMTHMYLNVLTRQQNHALVFLRAVGQDKDQQ